MLRVHHALHEIVEQARDEEVTRLGLEVVDEPHDVLVRPDRDGLGVVPLQRPIGRGAREHRVFMASAALRIV
jgi:hypothetical protein